MRGCGTIFNEPEGLTEGDLETLAGVERIAIKHEFIALHLRSLVEKCKSQQTMEGFEMTFAFAFNAQQYTPSYGGGGSNLPPGKYKGVIVDASQERSKNGGGYLAFQLSPIEGALQGQRHTDRLNLHNTNPVTVQIANEQLSAYCHVIGVYQIANIAELFNKPFLFEIGYQKGQEPTPENPNGGFTEVKALADINGNPPGKAGAGPQAQAAPAPQAPPPPPAAQPAAPAPAGWGGAPAAQPAPAGWGGAPAAQPAQPTPAAAPAAAPDFLVSAPPAQAAPPAQGAAPAGWGAPPATGAAPAGWGQ